MFFKQGKDEIPNCKPNLVEIFSRRKKISVKTQGKMKMTKMKSCIFSKIWKEISLKNISPRNFFFFSWRNIFESCLQILENPKNFMISFFHPLNLSGVVLGENLSSLLSKGLSGKKCFNNFHFLRTPSKTFPSIYSQTFPNPIPDQSQSHQSLPLKTKIQFDQNFLPAKQSANHSMFFRRL